MEEPWRILEFYSGIGGMRYSLLKAGIRGEVIQAFDINNVANDVYQHNFGHRPFQGNIQSLTAAKLDEYGAHAWLLSPPCQPYTRQGLRKQSADARAFSFVKILELIPRMLQSPTIIFVENVVGFETSDTHGQMMEILSRTEFIVQEFILSPLQFGVPYSRPRYFCLAKKKPLSFPNPSLNGQLLRTPIPLRMVVSTRWMDGSNHHEGEEEEFCEPIRNFLETSPLYNCKLECTKCSSCRESNDSIVHDNDNTSGVSIVDSTHEDGIYMISDNTSKKTSGSCDLMNALDAYYVPLSLIDRWGNVMDIVYPDSKRCCCFTKSYYRYVKGTGSLLATVGNRDSTSTNYHEISSLKMLGLRYFTPQEVANMHSFPRDFWFPPHICIRQHFSTARMFHMRMSNDLEILIKSITRGWMELAQWKKQMKQREDITVHHPVVCRSIGCEDKIKIMKSNPRESRT